MENYSRFCHFQCGFQIQWNLQRNNSHQPGDQEHSRLVKSADRKRNIFSDLLFFKGSITKPAYVTILKKYTDIVFKFQIYMEFKVKWPTGTSDMVTDIFLGWTVSWTHWCRSEAKRWCSSARSQRSFREQLWKSKKTMSLRLWQSLATTNNVLIIVAILMINDMQRSILF